MLSLPQALYSGICHSSAVKAIQQVSYESGAYTQHVQTGFCCFLKKEALKAAEDAVNPDQISAKEGAVGAVQYLGAE